MFNTEITDEEKEAGFKLKSIRNPEKYFLEQEKVEAVVLDLGLSDRIIKINSPAHGIVYSHQRFGKYDWETDDIEPGWKPIRDVDFTLIESLKKSFANIEDKDIKIISKIPTITQY